MKHLALIAVLLPALAAADDVDPGGTLNPDEMSLNSALEKAIRGEVSMTVCAQGYLMTKKGSHEEARRVFENCAEAGYTGTMTWMSYMEDNGLGDDYDPVAAAEWDRRAAEAGDPVGKFNYGLSLLRGHGVVQDEAAGRALVDEAAEAGLKAAQALRAAEYDTDVVTPDADNWKYAPLF